MAAPKRSSAVHHDLDSDVLGRVLAFARPQDAVSIAQSCKALHKAHQMLKTKLRVDELHQHSSQHVLGLTAHMAYVQLVIPQPLISLGAQQLTAPEIVKVVLALKPRLSHLQDFVEDMFRNSCSCSLFVRLQCPGTLAVIGRRLALAPVFRALFNSVTQDLRAVISSYTQALPSPTLLKVYYEREIDIQMYDQSCAQLYADVEKQLGQDVVQTVFDNRLVADLDGYEYYHTQWKETGLAALFGRVPSVLGSIGIGDFSADWLLSGSAQTWHFTPTAAQVVSARWTR
ncbi:hypothetical protein ABBQ38_012185 [Trebouxia sp. C0009 RCD-2024]